MSSFATRTLPNRSWLSVFSQLRTRLLLLILLVLLPALLLIVYTAMEQGRQAINTAQQEALRLAQVAASDQEQLVEGARQLLLALAQLPVMSGGKSEECDRLFVRLHEQYQNYTNLFVVDARGDTYCTGIPSAGPVNVAGRQWFQRAMQTKGFSVADYDLGVVSKRPVITFS